jgi:hypothetical protein
VEVSQNGGHLGPRKDDGKADRALGAGGILEALKRTAQHLAIEKQQSAEGLVLGRRADVRVGSEMGQEGLDLGRAHGLRRTPPAEGDEPAGPE